MRFTVIAIFIAAGASPLAAQPAAPVAVAPNAPSPDGQTVKMDALTVTAQQQQLNTIDRKIYNVGGEIAATTGSAADILQNIPSVEVDIDGNVSLRGDSSVQILIDGKSSALMGDTGRADVLSQLPADSIERIEVITNPSAEYKPDGSGGIINIVLKKKHTLGYSGSVRLTVGNDRRYGLSVGGNYHPKHYNLFGNYAVRQDDRVRLATDQRSFIDPVTGLPATTESRTTETSRPLFQLGQAGVDYDADPDNKLTEVVDFTYRTFLRIADEHDVAADNFGVVNTDYVRARSDPEREGNVQSRSTYEHDFGSPDETLTLDFRAEHHTETERNSYTNYYTTPVGPPTMEYIRVSTNEPGTEASAEYVDPMGKEARLELGFDRSDDPSHQNNLDLLSDPVTGILELNPLVTNSFYLDQTVTALYGTYREAWGNFAALAGIRVEAAEVFTNQITSQIVNDQRYDRLYPSLHLSYDLTSTQQLQLNYSHRVRRPDPDDLNPYPHYQDPYNLSAGNPYLKPAEVHSIEAGYQYKNADVTYLGTLFYRYTYNSFTQVSQYINATTLLTTQENLGDSTSGGLEFATTTSPFDHLIVNASGDIFYNRIDASNLGYSARASAYAWAGKLSADYAWSKVTHFQLDANYTAKRLTPQGVREPGFVANLGYKHDFKGRNLSLVLTVSDLFNSLKEETKLDSPGLVDDSVRRRSSRLFNAGLIYTFGTTKTKAKDDSLQFDNQL